MLIGKKSGNLLYAPRICKFGSDVKIIDLFPGLHFKWMICHYKSIRQLGKKEMICHYKSIRQLGKKKKKRNFKEKEVFTSNKILDFYNQNCTHTNIIRIIPSYTLQDESIGWVYR